MADLLVKLYALAEPAGRPKTALPGDIAIRRANAWERHVVVEWVRTAFTAGWASECEVAFAQVPPRCFLALRESALVGFACHDVTRRNFFGPMGVSEAQRGQGIGAALTLAALDAMRADGYAYAIIGGTGPSGFYERVANAIPIPDSTPGIYDLALIARRMD